MHASRVASVAGSHGRADGCVQVKGSATACILRCLPDEGELHAANLGDSGFLVVRGGNPVFQTPQQQHHFNFPYQLGSKAMGAMNDGPESAQVWRSKRFRARASVPDPKYYLARVVASLDSRAGRERGRNAKGLKWSWLAALVALEIAC